MEVMHRPTAKCVTSLHVNEGSRARKKFDVINAHRMLNLFKSIFILVWLCGMLSTSLVHPYIISFKLFIHVTFHTNFHPGMGRRVIFLDISIDLELDPTINQINSKKEHRYVNALLTDRPWERKSCFCPVSSTQSTLEGWPLISYNVHLWLES